MKLFAIERLGIVDAATVPELAREWRSIRRRLLTAFVWCPILVGTLAIVAVVPIWVGSGATMWSWIPPVSVAVVAIPVGLVLSRGGIANARWWRPVAFYSTTLQVVLGPAGALVLMALGVDRDAPTWMIRFAYTSALIVPIASMIAAHFALDKLYPPTTGEWGEVRIDARFDLRYLGHPAGHVENARHKSLEQILSMTVSDDSVSIAVGSTRSVVVLAFADSGTYTRIPLSDILDSRSVTLGQEVLSAPWMILRSGTPIWAAPGEAVQLRARGGEFVVPVDNANVVADLIGRRVRRASQRRPTEHVL